MRDCSLGGERWWRQELGNVTKSLQRQRRDSQWRMQDFVNGGTFTPFPRRSTHTGSEVRGLSIPGNFWNQPRRNRHRKTAAPPPSENNATRRRVSRIILASVVNASTFQVVDAGGYTLSVQKTAVRNRTTRMTTRRRRSASIVATTSRRRMLDLRICAKCAL